MNSQGVLLVSTVLMAALAALLRRYQLGKELLNDGTLLPGSKMQVILPILLALYAAAVIVLLRPLRKKRSWQEVFPPMPLLNGVQIFCALLLFVGNISTLTKPAGSAQQLVSAFSVVLTRIRPWMGFAAALCMAAFAGMRMSRQKPTVVLYIAVSVYLVVRLILSFLLDALRDGFLGGRLCRFRVSGRCGRSAREPQPVPFHVCQRHSGALRPRPPHAPPHRFRPCSRAYAAQRIFGNG